LTFSNNIINEYINITVQEKMYSLDFVKVLSDLSIKMSNETANICHVQIYFQYLMNPRNKQNK